MFPETTHYSTNRADFARLDQVQRAQPLRMAANHESFLDLYARAISHLNQCAGLFNRETYGLFAEDMLAGVRGLDGPGDMHMIWKRVVNSLHF